MSHGYKIIASSGSGVGTSGKARYSADVSITDYRWVWTMVRDDHAPPPYPIGETSNSYLNTPSSSRALLSSSPILQNHQGKYFVRRFRLNKE